MKRYKLLLSKKEYVLLVVDANSEKEAVNKAYENEFIEAIHDPEKLPDSNYVIEKVIVEKKSKDKICKYCDGLLSETGSMQCAAYHEKYQKSRKS